MGCTLIEGRRGMDGIGGLFCERILAEPLAWIGRWVMGWLGPVFRRVRL